MRTNVSSEGYLIRIVDPGYHSPPALVAWKSTNFTASWVNVTDIQLKSRSESANVLGKISLIFSWQEHANGNYFLRYSKAQDILVH